MLENSFGVVRVVERGNEMMNIFDSMNPETLDVEVVEKMFVSAFLAVREDDGDFDEERQCDALAALGHVLSALKNEEVVEKGRADYFMEHYAREYMKLAKVNREYVDEMAPDCWIPKAPKSTVRRMARAAAYRDYRDAKAMTAYFAKQGV